jgi:NADH-quinone oxidoreductase subunit J
MSSALFYLFAALTAGCAMGVVFNRNSVHAAFCLLLSLLGTAGLFVMLNAYLLAVLLVLVYAGAVVALFVFIIMLLGMQGEQKKQISKIASVTSLLAFILLLWGAEVTFTRDPIIGLSAMPDIPAGSELGRYAVSLFSTYMLPVQISGFLLLISMLGVIVLAKKDKAPAKV